MKERMKILLEGLKTGKEIVLETIEYNEAETPIKILFYRDQKWFFKKATKISNEVVLEEISVEHSEAMQALRDYLERERGKERKRKRGR